MKFYSQADEMRDYCSFYLIIFLIVWAFSETYAIRRRNEKNQQTFVVRYKNGDQTIPVTVVLDDKKQTEYVINMSPRTPDKSVTLYDFKQRTIAYKDLTNRECFLGRLTDETLNHEIDALSEVQSPIESHPKVLSLVPHKSALTPTEIRNIAGQKTAVFCRKMNTWLIMPQGNHRILKREVDEVEERSYSRHGFHTVKYSHHGHEIRRRYRKPSATSSQSTLEEQSIPEPQSRKNGLQSWNSTPENESKDDLHFEDQFERRGGDNHYSSVFIPERNFKHGDHTKIRNENFSSDYLDNNKRPLETDLNSSTQSPGSETKYEDRDLVADSNNKKYIQSSEWDPLLYPSTLQNRNGVINIRNTNDGTLNAHYRQSKIETEGDFSNETLDIPEGKIFLTSDIPEEHTENPDVSINVLEIPKISKKFETVDHVPGIHETFVQPDEDVHSIFEGFHNLNGNLAASRSHDSYSPVSLNTIRNRQRTKNISDYSLKAIDSERSPTQDRVPLSNFYGEHISQTTTSTPVSKQKHFLATNSLDTNTLNLDKIDYSDSLHNKHINHHRKSEVLSENNFLSGNLNPEFHHSQISVENKDNINSIPHLRFNNPNVPTNFNIGKISDDKQQNSDKFVKNQPVFPPNQVHLHDILRNFKPDEIVIDIEKIPTEKPPDSTFSFRGRDTSFTRNHDHRPSSNKTYSFHSLGSNGNFENITNSSRTINYSQKLPSQRFHLSRTKNFQFHNSNRYPASLPSSNFLRMDPKEISPSFLSQLPRLGALPPGVSLHPRHPQAPYADMVRTNMLHTLPQRNINRAIKPHRQRHHRKKDHHDSSSCCKSNSRLSTCCSWHLRRGMHINSSCCASFKHRDSLNQRNSIPSVHSRRVKYRSTALPIKDTLPVQVLQSRDNLPPVQRKVHDDKKDRCQKAKMCRTLYESTRQVMVCRNINVDGC